MTVRYTKQIVCLANSRKPPDGRCIAGREINDSGFGGWIRAVSARPTHELLPQERCYRNGKDPCVLDIVSISMKIPQPHRYQQENHLIDDRYRWLERGRVNWQALQAAVETPSGPLWLNGYSSYHGQNDRVPESEAEKLTRSLYLIRPEQLLLSVASEGDVLGPLHRRVRARFSLCGHSYILVVTDPKVEADLIPKEDGLFTVKEALLCISLGEIYHGFAYKLAATVITPQRART